MKMEILAEFPVPSDQTMIVKGKRTKRPRPTSSADDSHNSLVCSSSSASTEDMAANCLILLARGDTTPPPHIFVYECKTCNRTFQSFQALGGHRASHKRPKLDQEVDKQLVTPPPLPNKISTDQINKLPKIHECSICGSEFASGQALGGHMRRHRVEKPRNVLPLDLDLNLPAPAEVDDKYNHQPRRIAFPAAALVDCHY